MRRVPGGILAFVRSTVSLSIPLMYLPLAGLTFQQTAQGFCLPRREL
jgi:hypothetical protein